MKMKLSTGAKVALGLGALVILYLVMKKTGSGQPAAITDQSGSGLVLPPLQPISSAGIVAIDVQPPLIPLTIQLN